MVKPFVQNYLQSPWLDFYSIFIKFFLTLLIKNKIKLSPIRLYSVVCNNFNIIPIILSHFEPIGIIFFSLLEWNLYLVLFIVFLTYKKPNKNLHLAIWNRPMGFVFCLVFYGMDYYILICFPYERYYFYCIF
jgi:hypothetical protein